MYWRSYGRNNRLEHSEGGAIGGPAFFMECQFIMPFLVGGIYTSTILAFPSAPG